MSTIDELVQNAGAYSESFEKGELPLPPAKRVAIAPAWMPA
jgi:carbonic anhydrase